MSTRFPYFLIGLLAVVFIVGTSERSEAAFIAYICNDPGCVGGGDVIVSDGSAGDGSAVSGVIITSGSVGGLSVTVNTATSKPAIPDPGLDISFYALGVGEAWFYATDTGFLVIGPLFGSFDGNFSGTGSVQATIYGGVDNTQGTLANPVSGAVLTSSPFHDTFSHPAATTSPYSLTIGVHTIRTSPGLTTGDLLVTAVPEPASLVLLGTGLLGAAAARRRRQRNSKL